MNIKGLFRGGPACRESAFTLTELVVSIGLSGLMVGGIITGYMQTMHVAEWSAYSLAAHSQAMQGTELCRAAKWDPLGYPPVDQLVSANFPVRIEVLDIPITGNNVVYATNRTTITQVSSRPALKLVRVDTTWSFPKRGVFTNTIITYRAPDQ